MILLIKCKYLFYALLFYSCFSFSQITIKGIVKDKETKQPLAYANIGLKLSKEGAISNEKGEFLIETKSQIKNDTLIISYLGYKSIQLPITSQIEFKEFLMTPANLELDAVVLDNYIYKKKVKLGLDVVHNKLEYNFNNYQKGNEIGRRIEVETPILIEKIDLFIKENTFTSIKVRLNFYELNKYRQPTERIELDQPIIVDINKKGKFTIDVSDYNLKIDHHFLITFEAIDKVGEGQFTLQGEYSFSKTKNQMLKEMVEQGIDIKDEKYISTPFNSGCYIRQHNQDNWVVNEPHTVAIKVHAREAEF
ncbi:carboxypeptidase-like regulatory domain-containing protein [Winogradskyella immobilis]|uniref:Carboxypeptidase-like regulatory domain-containing protein n=1 Tax=Winogradskyella immobilis TaxID=2816852 RepID=A0ABS8EIQ9_9FLAO|nr:carboxypeptidase-like regulatory domain-containing protein [Winogradskyella immobilis]MCC1483099.1 carboxypeptidase-like regulatory domain-containing protein [Winogradskyella immobilis]MCG0015194.1 carboxypeptidase-like regulatory domain-containing protein [Winogradskyella immobilis]